MKKFVGVVILGLVGFGLLSINRQTRESGETIMQGGAQAEEPRRSALPRSETSNTRIIGTEAALPKEEPKQDSAGHPEAVGADEVKTVPKAPHPVLRRFSELTEAEKAQEMAHLRRVFPNASEEKLADYARNSSFGVMPASTDYPTVPFSQMAVNCPALEKANQMLSIEVNEDGKVHSAVVVGEPDQAVSPSIMACEFTPFRAPEGARGVTTVYAPRAL